MVLASTISGSPLGQVTRDSEEFVTELRNLPQGWLAVGGLALIAALCWAVIWMYRHEGRIGASSRARGFLATVRCLVLVALAVILLEPVRVRILRQWIDSYTVVLLDDSSSMDLADTYRDDRARQRVSAVLATEALAPTRRSELIEHVLGDNDRAFLKALAANNRIKLYTFSDEPRLRATVRAGWEGQNAPRAPAPPTGSADSQAGRDGGSGPSTSLALPDDVSLSLAATGPATNVDRALRRAIESLGGAPVAAVVVLSDGGFNQGGSAQEAARFANDRRIPIYTVGVGDPSPPRNVRVVEVLAPENAFQEDPFSVTARLTAEGLAGRTISVELRERDATRGGEGKTVETRSAAVGPGGSIEPVVFSRQKEDVGRFVFTVEVPLLDAETVVEDNTRSVSVNVIEAQTRVLLVAGQPSWEYRYVTRLLQRDDTFDVSCWLQSADLSAVRDGDTVIDHLPKLPEELFAFDVVILMDPDPAELDESWARLLDTLVSEYGGGLIYAAARQHTPTVMRDRALKPMRDLLPVTVDPEADLLLNRIGHYQLEADPIDVPPAVAGHPVLQLSDDPASTRLAWRQIGDVYWHYPVRREKPAATVLMRHGDPAMRNAYGGHVLAAVQFVGAGRTSFLALDGTWRWRKYGVEIFDRFWVQLIRYLAEGKLLGGSRRGMILTESDQYSLGEAVTVTARLYSPRYEPLPRDEVPATYEVDGRKMDFRLLRQADRAGWFEGRFVPDATGAYRISVQLAGAGVGETVEIAREIRVARPNLEIIRPQMARGDLMTLAEQSYGGRYFEIDEAREVPSLIPDLHAEIPVRSRPTTLWDNWVTLAVLVALLAVEWAVRKWNRLL